MKFTCDTQTLTKGLSIVTRAIATKSPTPVLDGVLMECDDRTLRMTCTDGQMVITCTGDVATDEPGTCVLPGRLLSEIMRKASGATVTVKADSNAALIACGKSRSRLSMISGTYPHQEDITNPESITIPASSFRNLINHVLSSISTDQSRIILTGALLEITPGTVSMVSLDGFRLAVKHLCQQNGIASDRIRAVIPRKTLTELSRLLPSDNSPVDINVGNGRIQVSLRNAVVSTVLFTGEYMDYSKIIPQTATTSILVNRQDLATAIDRASLLAREGKSNLITLRVENNSVSISSRADIGNTEEQIECLQNGNDITISFNSAYISDAVRNSPDDDVTIRFTAPTSPAVITSAAADTNNWLYLVLPVRTA